MEETILIAGSGVLHSHLIQACLSRNCRVISTAYSDEFQESGNGETAAGKGQSAVLSWNPGSSLSPRNILSRCDREAGPLDSAYLVFPSGRTTEAFHETSSAAVQKILDYRVKSYLFFLKELITYFMARKRGTQNAVLYSEEGEILSPLIAGTYEMFRALIRSCFSAYEREPFRLRGFESRSTDLENYGEFILQHSLDSDKKENQFFQYPRKKGFLNR